MEAKPCHNQERNGSSKVELGNTRVEGSLAIVLIDLRAIRCTLVCKMKKWKLEKDPSDSQRMRGKGIDTEKDVFLL